MKLYLKAELDTGRLDPGVGKPPAKKPLFAFTPGEGNQRINIAFSGNGFIEDNGADSKEKACEKSPEIEQGCQKQQDHPHEF